MMQMMILDRVTVHDYSVAHMKKEYQSSSSKLQFIMERFEMGAGL